MFKLFERQPNWALKQLVQETDQPAVCLFTYISYYSVMFAALSWKTLLSMFLILLLVQA